MAQSNYNVPNASAPAVRAQLNSIFGSVATNNSGSTPPSTTFAYQWWYDTSTNILKMRNAADSDWIEIGKFNQSGGTFQPELDLAGLTEETSPADADLLLLEKAADGAKRKVKVENIGGAPSTSEVLAATAGASAGAVGTYTFATRIPTGNLAFGATSAGSDLRPASAANSIDPVSSSSSLATGSALAGTWRAMGTYTRSSGEITWGATLWLRIS